LHEWFGWRSVFVFLACFSAAVALLSAVWLPETHPPERRQPLQAARLLRQYCETLTHPGFLSAASVGALGFAALFLYVAAAPVLLLKHLHVPETQFLWLFGPTTAGLMLGGFLSGRVAGRLSTRCTLGWSVALMLAATAGNLAFHAMHPPALPWTVLPLFFYGTGIALALPTLTLLGLDYFPAHRGLASSCQAFLLTAANAMTAGLLAPFASESPLRLALVSAGLLAASLVYLPFIRRGAPAPVLPA
jgi:DHA1 family bicyclomycin/chloramphenicol resistance-like MFS transporter